MYILTLYSNILYLFSDKNVKSNPIVGDTVKVFSMSKNSFCRAKILKNCMIGWYNVFYIDFGSIEQVPSKNIYELADELQKKVLFHLLFSVFIFYLKSF